MRKLILLALVGINCYALSGSESQEVTQGVTSAMDQSVKCWNAGDLECFMKGYVNSPKTLFISGDKFIYGWQSSYDHYKRKYGSDKKGMGQLQIKIDGIEALDEQHAFLYGHWKLQAESKEYAGVTSLLFKKNDNKWQIMVDHSN
ncbi:MAG: hypothetical protein EKK54_09045 [Neisseriaceae bacterium]|nr:MAG: hypothetical protein EKK54_09045 [Neisseriaceae bacterium]